MAPSLPARGLLGLIQLYKWTLSPLIGRGCRYLPSCSSYAAESVRRHGAWAGSWMAGARLCRCHPWGGHGWDPAPAEKPSAPWWAPWRLGDWSWRKRDSWTAGETPAVQDVALHSDRPPPPTPAPPGGGGRAS